MEESEYMATVGDLYITVNKVGGGTLGKAYEGDWTVWVASDVKWISLGEALHTGTPKTHAEVALLAYEFATDW